MRDFWRGVGLAAAWTAGLGLAVVLPLWGILVALAGVAR